MAFRFLVLNAAGHHPAAGGVVAKGETFEVESEEERDAVLALGPDGPKLLEGDDVPDVETVREIAKLEESLKQARSQIADLKAENAALQAKLEEQQAEGDSDEEVSEPDEDEGIPGETTEKPLSGKNKAELLSISDAMGLGFDESNTVADMRAAIAEASG